MNSLFKEIPIDLLGELLKVDLDFEKYVFIVIVIFVSVLYATFRISDNLISSDYNKPLKVSFTLVYRLIVYFYIITLIISAFLVVKNKFISINVLVYSLKFSFIISFVLICLFYFENKRIKELLYYGKIKVCLKEFNNSRNRNLRIFTCILIFLLFIRLNLECIMPNVAAILISIFMWLINYANSRNIISYSDLASELELVLYSILILILQIFVIVYSLNISKKYAIVISKFLDDNMKTIALGLLIDESKEYYIIKDSTTNKVILLPKNKVSKVIIKRKTII